MHKNLINIVYGLGAGCWGVILVRFLSGHEIPVPLVAIAFLYCIMDFIRKIK